MLKLQTKLEGQKAYFGVVRDCIRDLGYHLGGNWDYDKGFFDHILCREEGETIYIRIPFIVTDGELDKYDTSIEFGTSFVIKHVVHVGLDREGSSLLDATGFSQFQYQSIPMEILLIKTDGFMQVKSLYKNFWIVC